MSEMVRGVEVDSETEIRVSVYLHNLKLEELISLRVLLQSRHGRCSTQNKLNLLGRTLINEPIMTTYSNGNTTKATTKGFVIGSVAPASFLLGYTRLSLDSDEVVGSEEIGPNWCEENVRQYKTKNAWWYVRMLQHDELRIETLVIVDGKTVVISESSVRSDLHFNDKDGITCLTNDAIFENLALMGRAKRGRDTEIPQSSGPLKKVSDEAVYKGEDDRVVRAATTATSLEAEQENGNIHKTRPTATLNEPSPRGTGSEVNTSGSGEDSMEDQDDLMDFVPPTPHDSPLSGGHAPRSDEGRPNLNELINLCTQLSNRVLALEQSNTAQDLVIIKLQKKVKKLEKALRVRTLGMKLFKIGTSKRKSLDKENVSKQGRNDSTDKTKELNISDKGSGGTEVFNDTTAAEKNVNAIDTVNAASVIPDVSAAGPSTIFDDTTAAEKNVNAVDTVNAASVIPDVSAASPSTSTAGPSTSTAGIFEDEMTTIADTLVAIRSARPRTISVVIRDVEEEPRRATRAQIAKDAEIAQRLFEEEQAQFEKEMDADALLAERLQQEEREQFTVDEQARMLVNLIAERKSKYTHNQLKSKSFKEIQKLYEREQKWINDFVPMDDDSGKKDDDSQQQAESSKKRPRADPDEESAKKQKLEDATKYPIVDWKIHILTENMMYYQIVRAYRSSKNYKIFSEMLDDFDRQDMIDLYRLVKERYETTIPKGHDLLLWGDLKTLFEPSEEDEIWRN
ncbi:hypothetical protein Tco_0045949 [Tanacetum coccineum]